ncbi:hypothetical protein P4U43_00430 [Arthrobacter sp. EH-1B-1]|uniref:Uncharacterized protein n=1 Tax=Arthrobacter vasquezii TaxID=2977629 RepID=A0ABT6CT04_9MICC|nr:hypothetical protein [Arthrobacter vasquezii]MDF9276254.1 hypothetical protein [Arthrobacter vasquezii]
MPVGDCENDFLQAARIAGIDLVRYKQPWLNQRGHFGLPDQAESVVGPLDAVFNALGGNAQEQAAKRTTPLPGDFIHPPTGTIIEIDEAQHFTSFRLRTFDFYPDAAPLDFEIGEYRDLCRRLAPKSDKYRAAKTAVGFGEGGRQRQRAYYDALRDLAAPAMGLPPVIRVAAPDGYGQAAFEGNRDRILRAIAG